MRQSYKCESLSRAPAETLTALVLYDFRAVEGSDPYRGLVSSIMLRTLS